MLSLAHALQLNELNVQGKVISLGGGGGVLGYQVHSVALDIRKMCFY